MTYSIVLERITEAGFAPGYYQAYIPRLGLATHGGGQRGQSHSLTVRGGVNVKVWD